MFYVVSSLLVTVRKNLRKNIQQARYNNLSTLSSNTIYIN